MASVPRGQSRTVPDPDGDAYDEMLRREREKQSFWDTRPGLAESMVPVWGSTREAIADFREGDLARGAMNTALAVSDVAIPGAFAWKGLGKAGVKAALKQGRSKTWGATQKRMARAGHFEPDEQGHHWLIPQGGRGAKVPNVIKNHPMNIKVLPKDVHKRIHTADRIKDLPRYSVGERIYHGTPAWAKLQTGVTVANGAIKTADKDR